MQDIYYKQLAKEFDLTDFVDQRKLSEEDRKAYLDEIREWLLGIIEDEDCIELECGVELPVVREVPPNTTDTYLTVKWKDKTVYAVRERRD